MLLWYNEQPFTMLCSQGWVLIEQSHTVWKVFFFMSHSISDPSNYKCSFQVQRAQKKLTDACSTTWDLTLKLNQNILRQVSHLNADT